jgi:histidine phosphotransferase ChpT
MNGICEIRVFELLMVRLCHDLAGPIAAVGNGAEMLADDDPEFAEAAVGLVADSAGRAADKLQFYRFAYGIVGDAQAPANAPADLAARFFAATTIACDYTRSARLMPLAWQKLACNLLLVGADGLPRGGTLAVTAGASGPVLDAVGEAGALAPEVIAALNLAVPASALTPRSVQAYFAALLAGVEGGRLRMANGQSGRFRIDATPPPRRPDEAFARSAVYETLRRG